MFNKRNLRILVAVLLLVMCTGLLAFAETGHHDNLGKELPLWSCIPFVGMLLSIAIFPLVKPHWWEMNMLKVALFWSLLFLIPFGFAFGMGALSFQIAEIVFLDYLPFIVLLFGLFVAAGGIVIKGSFAGSTKTNIIMLLIGTAIASWVGTTGAAMLMIRPIMRANEWRAKKAHIIIFFIFMVANIGGSLTPVGDPPLFLGFLRGVPFFWTMKLLPVMLFNIAVLTIVFFFVDRVFVKGELAAGRKPPKMDPEKATRFSIEGAHNFIFVAMIVGAVILNGILSGLPAFQDEATGALLGINLAGAVMPYTSIIQMAIILLAAFLSMKLTKKTTREANEFNFGPIAEVAKLFIGIFLTMIPALAILKANGASLGLIEPWQFFWVTGALSSFLDNAPTYLVFLTTACACGFTEGLQTTIGIVDNTVLVAISSGAVFMGANTYIGNAPNFMVKAIAEDGGIKMPSFFGYMLWALIFLVPLFVLDTLIFFL